jgi:hypothetical protein
MITMFSERTQTTIIAKVKVHANFEGNERVDKLANLGTKLPHKTPLHSYEKAHSTPYYFHKDWYYSMDQTPNKGPIWHLQRYLIKYDKKCSPEYITHNISNIDKWTSKKINSYLTNYEQDVHLWTF